MGRLPGPTLLEKLPLEVFREDTDCVRDVVEDVKDWFRLCPIEDIDFCHPKLATSSSDFFADRFRL
jgi:hypothetical protein